MVAERVLVVNAGSSSLKLRLLDGRDALLGSEDITPPDDVEAALARFIDEAGEPDAVGHRIVHGGATFTAPIRLDENVEDRLEELAELAPLHNPPAVRAAEAMTRLRPDLPSVACFDTAFHADLPAAASTYALPEAWSKRWALRRYGFHGLSHAYAARRAAELLGRPASELRLVTAHLGAGASLAAVAGGQSIDTTMGFTPLEGLVMATRSGSVDPGLLLWVQREGEIAAAEAERALETEAGLLGLSGRSGDLRGVLAGIDDGDARCREAFAVYMHRLVTAIGAMAAALGGIDALVFTGGIGENTPLVRSEACGRLGFLGVAIDRAANDEGAGDRIISPGDTPGKALVVEAREDLEIAAAVRAMVGDRTT